MKIQNVKAKSATLKEEEKWLAESAEKASSKAIRSSKALGLTIKFIEKDSIIEVKPSSRNILRKKSISNKIDISKLKKGMTLDRK